METAITLAAMVARLSPELRSSVERRGQVIIAEELTRRAIRELRGETQD